jgi:hypothetical protein
MSTTGAADRCPTCGAPLWAPPAEPFGSRRCPRCGAELWVVGFSSGPRFFVRRPGESLADFVADLAAGRLGPADEVGAALKTIDSLDLVEFILELEERGQAGFQG